MIKLYITAANEVVQYSFERYTKPLTWVLCCDPTKFGKNIYAKWQNHKRCVPSIIIDGTHLLL